ncbi:MAG: exodeoxyribonuclease VII large subunit [Cloacibacillus sp.]
MLQNNAILTVDEMTATLKAALMREPALQNLSVRGELLGFKMHTSGHAYFTLIGENSRVSCVLFRSYAGSVLVWPKDGDEVLVRGKIDVYGARGSYQVYATTLLPLGAGAKARAKEALRAKLEGEGLFDVRLKRPLPRYPQRIAVITSQTGAALQDVLKLHSLRYPCAELVIIPSLMQGLEAAEEIVRAFERARRLADLSAVMLVRGGGSRDDLDTFDNEFVVRAIRLSPVPVITGLGHQIDSTLADMAADAAAPTPSGAAERLFPDGAALASGIKNAGQIMRRRLENRICNMDKNFLSIKDRLYNAVARGVIQPAAQTANRAEALLLASVRKKTADEERRLASFAARLENLSPLALLSKGYSICQDADGRLIRSAAALAPGQDIRIIMNGGEARAVIRSVSES